MSKLNACPICKKQPVLSQVEGYPMQYKLFCGTHVSVGDWFPNTLGAELDWNRRTTDLTQPDLYKPTNADRLRELAEADRGRRLVVLPCKVGCKIWTIENVFNGKETVQTIGSRVIDEIKHNKLNENTMISKRPFELHFYPSEVGKTVFLTREAAESALEAQK